VRRLYLAAGPVARKLSGRRNPGILVPREFLEPVPQQPIYRRGDRVPDDAHRLAGELCGRTNAAAQSTAVDQRRTPHLRAALVVCFGASVPQGPEKLGPVGQLLGGNRSTSDFRPAVRDSDPAAVRKVDTDRARRGGGDRRRVPGSAVPPHLSAIDGAGTGGSRHLRAAARLERASVPVHAALVGAQLDRGGGAGAILGQ